MPVKSFGLIEVDITRGNLNPLPVAVSPLSIDEQSRKNFENILKKKQWNTMTILAIKNNYKVWLNEQKVLDYTLENASLKGAVGLQLHPKRTMDIQFKEIFIKKL